MEIAIFLVILLFVIVSGLSKIFSTEKTTISEEPKASQAKEDPSEEKETVSLKNEIPTLENIDTDFEKIAIEEIKEEQQSTFDIENEKTNFIQARVEKLPGMVAVEKNSFQMGDTLGDGRDNEKPSHTVTITYDYYIASYEVSFEEYGRYAEDVLKTKHKGFRENSVVNVSSLERYIVLSPSNKVFRENSVVNVSWYEAIEYCNWLSKREGLSKAYSASGNFLDKNGRKTTDPSEVEGYRLPTEAEWESARSIISKNTDIWEWCSDWYSESYYEKSPQINPYNSSQEAFRVKRGGSLANNTNIRVSCRSYDYPKHRREDVGFRIARTKT